MLLLPAALWGAPGDGLKPPGDRTKEEYRQLDRAVGETCKAGPIKCEPFYDCKLLVERFQNFSRCAAARITLTERCFRGGDELHRKENDKAREGIERCLKIIRHQCLREDQDHCE